VKIYNLRIERNRTRVRSLATVQWEDSDRPNHEVFFETEETYADSLVCNPHAFLVGCVVPAMHHGEKRVVIDEEICPELRDGVITALSWIHHWFYDPDQPLVSIEARTRSEPLKGEAERTGFFFSSGIDSYANLITNRLNFPLRHRGSFKDALVVYGFHFEEPDNFRQILATTLQIAEQVGITPIPVYTNIVSLGRGWEFWENEVFGAAFAAVGHAFTRRLRAVSLASAGWGICSLPAQGSHPLVDPYYSSSDLRIQHDGITLSRIEKTRLVAEWDIALRNLRVCNNTTFIRPDMLNCGRCEKCVRTMLTFLAIGKLHRAHTFPERDISEDVVSSVVSLHPTTVPFYEQLVPFLASIGRNDLFSVIQHKLKQYYRSARAARLKSHIRQIDQKYFQGAVIGLKRSIWRNTQAKSR
jgi:hypothetical protein